MGSPRFTSGVDGWRSPALVGIGTGNDTASLLLRSAGPTASRRQPALILSVGKGRAVDWRAPSPLGIAIKSVISRGDAAPAAGQCERNTLTYPDPRDSNDG
jgi:hypothetical protein